MVGANKTKKKTKDKMRQQSNDLVTLAAIGNGESGSKEKDLIGSLPKWLETLQEGYTDLTPQKNDIAYGGALPKFQVRVIAGATTNDPSKKNTKKK